MIDISFMMCITCVRLSEPSLISRISHMHNERAVCKQFMGVFCSQKSVLFDIYWIGNKIHDTYALFSVNISSIIPSWVVLIERIQYVLSCNCIPQSTRIQNYRCYIHTLYVTWIYKKGRVMILITIFLFHVQNTAVRVKLQVALLS